MMRVIYFHHEKKSNEKKSCRGGLSSQKLYSSKSTVTSVVGLITELQQTWTQLPLNRMSMSAENNKSSAFVSKCNRVEVQIF